MIEKLHQSLRRGRVDRVFTVLVFCQGSGTCRFFYITVIIESCGNFQLTECHSPQMLAPVCIFDFLISLATFTVLP